MNPDRYCRVCENSTPEILKEIIEKYSNLCEVRDELDEFNFWTKKIVWKNDLTINDLLNDVEECPACTLAVLRQCDLLSWPGTERFDFSYKKLHDEWWKEHNEPYY
jgi:hypothetical protein